MAKVLIKNGLVISPTGVVANDVLIEGEKIAAVGAPGWFESSEQGCDKVIDAKGKSFDNESRAFPMPMNSIYVSNFS